MDGPATTKVIRKWAEYPSASQVQKQASRIPIIALTEATSPGERERALAAGMNDFLTKPIKLATLRKVLDKVSETLGI